MTHWITANWPAAANIHALTSLRTGGVSVAEFSSLNPASHVHDKAKHVTANRQQIKTMLSLPAEPVYLEQTHSVDIVCAEQVNGIVKADASYTTKNNIVCAVLTADCLPILLSDQQGKAIAAIHAGWRGLLNGIIENSLRKMPNSPIIAWLGPAISAECFEVGEEVYQAFYQKSAEFSVAFTQQITGKYLADIYQIARILLNNAGVTLIYGGDFCTVTEQERFYSYRRDGQTGRMVSLIWKTGSV